MHSRIYQITETPLTPVELLSEFDLPDWFKSSICDSASRVKDPKWDIESFLEERQSILTPTEDKKGFVLADGARLRYFEPYYKRFCECAAMLPLISLEAFAGVKPAPQGKDADYWLYMVKTAFNDEFGYYVFTDYEELLTMAEWMRTAEEGKTYYFGSVIDYHF